MELVHSTSKGTTRRVLIVPAINSLTFRSVKRNAGFGNGPGDVKNRVSRTVHQDSHEEQLTRLVTSSFETLWLRW